jgi:hypothetical protein
MRRCLRVLSAKPVSPPRPPVENLASHVGRGGPGSSFNRSNQKDRPDGRASMIVHAAAAVSLAALALGAVFVAASPKPISRGDRLAVRAEAPRTVTIEQRRGATSTLVRVPVAAFAQR